MVTVILFHLNDTIIHSYDAFFYMVRLNFFRVMDGVPRSVVVVPFSFFFFACHARLHRTCVSVTAVCSCFHFVEVFPPPPLFSLWKSPGQQPTPRLWSTSLGFGHAQAHRQTRVGLWIAYDRFPVTIVREGLHTSFASVSVKSTAEFSFICPIQC